MDFEAWARVQLPSMLRLATALCGSRPSAEDLVQDVLIKVHARWAQLQTLDHPEAYLRRMVINEHLSWRRRLASAWRRDTSSGLGLVDEPRPFDDRWVDRVELAAEIRKLPPRQRAVIVLRYLDDLTVAESAGALGCTESTVRAHTARALSRLRVALPAAAPVTPDAVHPPRPLKDRHAH